MKKKQIQSRWSSDTPNYESKQNKNHSNNASDGECPNECKYCHDFLRCNEWTVQNMSVRKEIKCRERM